MIRCRLLVAMMVLAGVSLLGCGDDAETPPTTAPPTTGELEPLRRHQGEMLEDHELPDTPRHTGGRVASVAGAATIGETAVAVGHLLGAGDVLRTEAGAEVSLDLARETRIEVGASTHLTREPLGDSDLLLHAGILRAQLPPTGGAPRPTLFIGTPAGTIEAANTCDIMVAVLPSGDTWVAAFQGAVSLSRGDVSEDESDRRLGRFRLIEGFAVLLGRTAIADQTDGPPRVEAAWATAAALIEGTAALAASERAALTDTAMTRYLEAAGWFAAELERGEALANEQREAAGSDPARARELTREIVAHSQRRVRLRNVAVTRYLQRAAAIPFAGREADGEADSAARELLSPPGAP